MHVSMAHLVALAAAPAAMMIGRRHLAPGAPVALVITALTTWLVATCVLCWFVPDPSDIGALLAFYYIVVPCLCIPIATIIATQLMPTRGRVVSAILLAMFGWIAGIAISVLVGTAHVVHMSSSFWDYALALALPVVYAACGAVLAASEQGRAY